MNVGETWEPKIVTHHERVRNLIEYNDVVGALGCEWFMCEPFQYRKDKLQIQSMHKTGLRACNSND